VYLESARRLGRAPARCGAIEDSANGIRSAVAAAMNVVAVPNHEFRPADEVLAMADLVIESLNQLTTGRLDRLDRQATNQSIDERLDEEEVESFPALIRTLTGLAHRTDGRSSRRTLSGIVPWADGATA